MANELFDAIVSETVSLGAFKANVIDAKSIETETVFRDMCAANYCGMYGKCHMCPPDVGEIDTLMSEIANYDYALVYQTVTVIEDSFDFEGMAEARKKTYPLSQSLRGIFKSKNISKVLHLGAGGCGVCSTCAKQTDEPCRFPDIAMPSLESYGINVSKLAKSANMKYTNGQDTVTYFGAVLFSTEGAENE